MGIPGLLRSIRSGPGRRDGRRCVVLLAALPLLGCVTQLDEALGCKLDSDCGGGESCDVAKGHCCLPRPCGELQGNSGACGSFDGGCGRQVECLDCPEGEVCGADEPRRCVCAPKACSDPDGRRCGVIDDCGTPLDCGDCPAGPSELEGFRCNEEQRCVSCQPYVCGTAFECGRMDDSCGGFSECSGCTLGNTCKLNCSCGEGPSCPAGACGPTPAECGEIDCPGCRSPESCGGGGVQGQCGCTVLGAGALCPGRCGDVPDCDGVAACGACPQGLECHGTGHVCVPVLRPVCWEQPQRWNELNDGAGGAVGGAEAVLEDGRLWLYYAASAAGESWVGRVPLTADGTGLDPGGAFERLDLGLPAGAGIWSGPALRSDGLELFLAVTPEYSLFSSHRSDTTRPWSALEQLVQPEEGLTGGTTVVLLADRRTVLYSHPVGTSAALEPIGRVEAARRWTTDPGDLRFTEYLGVVDLDAQNTGSEADEVGGLSLGCDGVAVLNGWLDTDIFPGRYGIVDLPLGDLGLADTPLSSPDQLLDGGSPLLFGRATEGPGCAWLYLSVYNSGLWRAPATPCP